MKIKVGEYVSLKEECISDWDVDDARYNMNAFTAYEVYDLIDNEIRLINPNRKVFISKSSKPLSYFHIEDIEKVLTKDEYPEYYI